MRSWLVLFACNLMWALQFTCVKLVQDQVGALFIVWGPMTLATVMLIPFVVRGQRMPDQKRERSNWDLVTFFLLTLLGIFPGQIFITWGTRWPFASNAALLVLTLPISTALLAHVLLAERMTPIHSIGFGLAIVGVLTCSNLDFAHLNFGKGYLLGDVLIFVATLGSAFYNSYSKRVIERYSPLGVLLYAYVGMSILKTSLVVAEEGSVFQHIPILTSRAWVGLVLLTFFHNFLSMVLFLKALEQLDAIQGALSNYLLTFFGIPIAVVWLGGKVGTASRDVRNNHSWRHFADSSLEQARC